MLSAEQQARAVEILNEDYGTDPGVDEAFRFAEVLNDPENRPIVGQLKTLRARDVYATIKKDTTEAALPITDRVLTVGDLGTLPAVEPLVDGILYRDTLAQVSGEAGCYKSFLTVGMVCALATGQTSFEGYRIPRRAKVLYVAAEGVTGLLVRIMAWCELTNVDHALLDGWLYLLPDPVQLGDRAAMDQLVEYARGLGLDLVVLDTRARCTVGMEENSATDQGRAIHEAERLQREAQCAVLAVHHSSRAGTAGRGSNAWDGAVWTDLRMTGADNVAKLHCAKHKDVPAGCDHLFRLVPHTVKAQLMPGFSEAQRSTLVISGASSEIGRSSDPGSEEIVAGIWRKFALVEALSTAKAYKLHEGEVEGRKVSQTTFYAITTKLVRDGFLQNMGRGSRCIYKVSDSALM
ncbi:hypothetical protein ABIC28_003004 [Rhodococcus sp. PvR044]|uniref:AAA family ATPase n=1 Tax=Rhodococcus sp. PvR044 TaxID=3156402 RepID=UPI00339353EF